MEFIGKQSSRLTVVMVLTVIFATGAMVSADNPATWSFFEVSSSGENVYLDPGTPTVNNDYLVYNYEFEITRVEVYVTVLGWMDAGVFEVGSGTDFDGLPMTILDGTFSGEESGSGLSVQIQFWVSADGRGHMHFTNVSMWGLVTEVRITGWMRATAVTKPHLTTGVIGGNGSISPPSGDQSFNSVVTLTAYPDENYQVKAWSGTDNDASMDTVNYVTMNNHRNVSVEFEPKPYLTTSVIGGNGSIIPSDGYYNPGDVVMLVAYADDGYQVKVWSGTDNDASTSYVNYVIMNGYRNVSVEFEPGPVYPGPEYIGDLNGDGWVDPLDMGIMAEHWLQTGISMQNGNINLDTYVDLLDFSLMAGNWLKDSSQSGYWKLDEADGVIATDSSGYDRDGTVYGTATWQPLAGRVDGALEFDGVDDYVLIADYPKFNTFTVTAWVYADTRPAWASIVNNWGDAMAGQFHFGLGSDGKLDLEVFQPGGNIFVTDSVEFPVNSWQHVAAVADGSKIRLYRNGAEVGTPVDYDGYLKKDFLALAIGCKLNNSGTGPDGGLPAHWDGLIDGVYVYGHALTAQEIADKYTDVEALMGHWPLDEITGTTAEDQSGYGHTGTVTNTTFDAASVAGQFGTALQFDGVDDYITVPDGASLNPTGGITVSAWIKADTWQPNAWQGSIVSKDEWDGANSGYALRCGENGRLSFNLSLDSGWAEAVTGNAIAILMPGDAIIAIDVDGDSSYLVDEGPGNLLTGNDDKYLNFGDSGSGFIVTPAVGSTAIDRFKMKTADDQSGRDPASWILYGTNDAIVSGDNSTGDAENWTLIDQGTVNLTDDRNTWSGDIAVSNSMAYMSYKMVFPTTKDNYDELQLNEIQFYGDSFMSTERWYHVAGTYDGSTIKAYVNGSKVASTQQSGSIDVSDYPLNIGRGTYDTTRLFDGAIDDVRIYDRALTDGEIAIQSLCSGLLTPGDFIIAVDSDTSSYPIGEEPSNVLDGNASTKYLNFGKEGGGFIVTPSGMTTQMVQSFTITTADDAEERDPASWQLYGTNDTIVSSDNSTGDVEDWTPIDSGSLSLPSGRQTPSAVVTVSNSGSYTSYKMLFPTLKDASVADSMQIADVAFYESTDGTGSSVLGASDPIWAVNARESAYPEDESPEKVLDRTTAKYLNYGIENSGFIVSPSVSAVVTGFQIVTANDAQERDPASWQLYGTNDTIVSDDNSTGGAENWMLIDSGLLNLPSARQTPSVVVTVNNGDPYVSYKMIFPTVKDASAANSMQITEIQFYE